MPLLDHFHRPLQGPRHWEGFHHAWAVTIAGQLNLRVLPKEYYAEPEISIGPEMEIDVATLKRPGGGNHGVALLHPTKPKFTVKVDYSHLEGFEIRVYRDVGGAELCGAIELISPANKDRSGTRRTFAAKCAGYLKQGIGLLMVDIVTARKGNLHKELFEVMEVEGRAANWKSSTGLYAVSYRAITMRKESRVEVWPEVLTLGNSLPEMSLWLSKDFSVPVDLEETYLTTCKLLRLPE